MAAAVRSLLPLTRSELKAPEASALRPQRDVVGAPLGYHRPSQWRGRDTGDGLEFLEPIPLRH